MPNVVQLVDAGDNPIDQAINDVATGGYRGYVLFGVRDDSGSALAADGTFHPITMDENGRLWVRDLKVGGLQAENQPAIQNPVWVAGVDGDGKIKGLFVDGGGALSVNVINGVISRNDQMDVYQIPREVKWAPIECTAIGNTVVVPGVTGAKIRVTNICFTPSANNTVSFKSDTTIKIQPMSVLAREQFFVNCQPAGFFFETEIGEDFTMALAAAGNVRGFINYVEV